MAVAEAVRHPVQAVTRTRDDVDHHRAAGRVSAYVYGDILVLAATAGLPVDTVGSGEAALVVLGTVLTTYVAHVLADLVGTALGGSSSRRVVVAELRDAVPILSAGVPSCLLLGAGALGWVSDAWAQALGSAWVVVRVAGIGLVYRRMHPEVGLARAARFGAVTALAIAAAVALKLALAH